MLHVNIQVEGLVQGVFYRGSAKKAADRLGIKGFARNDPDGSVYLEAESESQTSLDEFVAWCKAGPPSADVDTVSVTTSAPVNYDRFFIDH